MLTDSGTYHCTAEDEVTVVNGSTLNLSGIGLSKLCWHFFENNRYLRIMLAF